MTTTNRQWVLANRPDGPIQMREMMCGSNFESQDEPVMHFGLGPSITSVHKVRVVWPASGLQSKLRSVSPNQRLVIREPVQGSLSSDAGTR